MRNVADNLPSSGATEALTSGGCDKDQDNVMDTNCAVAGNGLGQSNGNSNDIVIANVDVPISQEAREALAAFQFREFGLSIPQGNVLAVGALPAAAGRAPSGDHSTAGANNPPNNSANDSGANPPPSKQHEFSSQTLWDDRRAPEAEGDHYQGHLSR